MKTLWLLLAALALQGCTFSYTSGQGFSLKPTHNIGFTPVIPAAALVAEAPDQPAPSP